MDGNGYEEWREPANPITHREMPSRLVDSAPTETGQDEDQLDQADRFADHFEGRGFPLVDIDVTEV